MSPPNASAPDAQAAAAARKARRKKTRWGADVETAKDDTKVAQAGSPKIPSVTSVPGSVSTAIAPPQQQLTGLKLKSSVPSGTPVPGQPSASGQPVGFPTSVSSQGHTATASSAAVSATPPPWYILFICCCLLLAELLSACMPSPVYPSTFEHAANLTAFALLAGLLVIMHPHRMVASIAQELTHCQDHLHRQQLSRPGYLSLLLLLMQVAHMLLILLLDHTQAMVQSITIRMLMAMLHLTCIRQHFSSHLQPRMTGACLS